MYLQFLLIPVTSMLIGYITNVIAIKLLFWPQKPVRLLGFKLQGLLPKRHTEIAEKIGELVENQLFSLEDITRKINTPEFHAQIIKSINDSVRTRLKHILPGFLPGKVYELITEVVEKILYQEAPAIIEQVFNAGQAYLSEEVKISKIVAEKIKALDLDQLEKLVKGVSSSELRFIEILGGVLGFFIGVIQLLILNLWG